MKGEREEIYGGKKVKEMMIKNKNKMNVKKEKRMVSKGFESEDIFVEVKEKLMKEKERMEDVILNEKNFIENEDIYRGGGKKKVVIGKKMIEKNEDERKKILVIKEMEKRIGVGKMKGLEIDESKMIEKMKEKREMKDLDKMKEKSLVEIKKYLEEENYIKGLKWKDGKLSLRKEWLGRK